MNINHFTSLRRAINVNMNINRSDFLSYNHTGTRRAKLNIHLRHLAAAESCSKRCHRNMNSPTRSNSFTLKMTPDTDIPPRSLQSCGPPFCRRRESSSTQMQTLIHINIYSGVNSTLSEAAPLNWGLSSHIMCHFIGNATDVSLSLESEPFVFSPSPPWPLSHAHPGSTPHGPPKRCDCAL